MNQIDYQKHTHMQIEVESIKIDKSEEEESTMDFTFAPRKNQSILPQIKSSLDLIKWMSLLFFQRLFFDVSILNGLCYVDTHFASQSWWFRHLSIDVC